MKMDKFNTTQWNNLSTDERNALIGIEKGDLIKVVRKYDNPPWCEAKEDYYNYQYFPKDMEQWPPNIVKNVPDNIDIRIDRATYRHVSNYEGDMDLAMGLATSLANDKKYKVNLSLFTNGHVVSVWDNRGDIIAHEGFDTLEKDICTAYAKTVGIIDNG